MRRPSLTSILAVSLAVLVFLTFLFFNYINVESSYANCLSIESLKEAQLDAAELSYSRLDETIRLLNLEDSPQIREVALRNLEEARTLFKPGDCKRIILGGS